MISIVIPAYNAAEYIKRAIDSVKAQTYADWQCIVVNDGSRDATLKVAMDETFGDKRFLVVSTADNRGLSAARNLGIRHATGKYVTFLDADDWLSPEALETMERETRGLRVRRGIFIEQNEWPDGRSSPWTINNPGLHLATSTALFASADCDIGHVTGCLYLREGLREFRKVWRFEDMIHGFESLFAGESVYISREVVYHYSRRPGSLINSDYSFRDANEARAAFLDIVAQYNPPAEVRERCETFLKNAIRGQLRKMGLEKQWKF